ncbi:UNVERIFIED_CONTAM: hypothetical protein PYX00_006431 [Menopon gallinae]|uniref:Uncharacterized protein n=1 Tax=Menopon gallinae TaxID=328185 RepID=A0AAW2HWF7_9NEOP
MWSLIIAVIAAFNCTVLGYRESRYREAPTYIAAERPRTYEWLPAEPEPQPHPEYIHDHRCLRKVTKVPKLVSVPHFEPFYKDPIEEIPYKVYKPDFEAHIPVTSRIRLPARRYADAHRPFIPPAVLNSEGCF